MKTIARRWVVYFLVGMLFASAGHVTMGLEAGHGLPRSLAELAHFGGTTSFTVLMFMVAILVTIPWVFSINPESDFSRGA